MMVSVVALENLNTEYSESFVTTETMKRAWG